MFIGWTDACETECSVGEQVDLITTRNLCFDRNSGVRSKRHNVFFAAAYVS